MVPVVMTSSFVSYCTHVPDSIISPEGKNTLVLGVNAMYHLPDHHYCLALHWCIETVYYQGPTFCFRRKQIFRLKHNVMLQVRKGES